MLMLNANFRAGCFEVLEGFIVVEIVYRRCIDTSSIPLLNMNEREKYMPVFVVGVLSSEIL